MFILVGLKVRFTVYDVEGEIFNELSIAKKSLLVKFNFEATSVSRPVSEIENERVFELSLRTFPKSSSV